MSQSKRGRTSKQRIDAQRNLDTIMRHGAAVLGRQPHASIGDIADAAGLARGTVYRHFRSRDALVRALVMRALGDMADALQAARLDEGPFTEALSRLIEGWYSVALKHRDLYGIGAVDPSLRAESEEAFGPLLRFFDERIAAGDLDPGVESRWAVQVLAGLIQVTVSDLDRIPVPDDQAVARITRSFLHGHAARAD